MRNILLGKVAVALIFASVTASAAPPYSHPPTPATEGLTSWTQSTVGAFGHAEVPGGYRNANFGLWRWIDNRGDEDAANVSLDEDGFINNVYFTRHIDCSVDVGLLKIVGGGQQASFESTLDTSQCNTNGWRYDWNTEEGELYPYVGMISVRVLFAYPDGTSNGQSSNSGHIASRRLNFSSHCKSDGAGSFKTQIILIDGTALLPAYEWDGVFTDSCQDKNYGIDP